MQKKQLVSFTSKKDQSKAKAEYTPIILQKIILLIFRLNTAAKFSHIIFTTQCSNTSRVYFPFRFVSIVAIDTHSIKKNVKTKKVRKKFEKKKLKKSIKILITLMLELNSALRAIHLALHTIYNTHTYLFPLYNIQIVYKCVNKKRPRTVGAERAGTQHTQYGHD